MTPALAQACLDHLFLEEAVLREVREALQKLRQALRSSQPDHLHPIDLSASQEKVQQSRAAVRDIFARETGLPAEQFTLSRLIEILPPPWADQAAAILPRLTTLADETRDLARRVAAAIACGQGFTRLLLGRLGVADSVERYGPGGRLGSGLMEVGR